jgi:beta-phosphoglucomutase-like phosphatase (HAD superfamily)
MLGLPASILVALFDLDRVLTNTAVLHKNAWKQAFERQKLRGKPAPDSFLACAEAFGVDPRNAAVFEDAPPGADAVVTDLAELLPP